MDKRRFIPTDVGRVVNKFLTNYFTQYVDYDFTAKLEDELDAVSRGEEEWVPLLRAFWQPFKDRVDDTEQNVARKDVTQEAMDEACPKCGKPHATQHDRRRHNDSSTRKPECDYTRSLGEEKEPE